MKQQAAANCRMTICHIKKETSCGELSQGQSVMLTTKLSQEPGILTQASSNKLQAAAICHIFIHAGSAIMHTVKQINKKDIKNENRQKKRSRQILQRPPEDAHHEKADDDRNLVRNQRHPVSGVRSSESRRPSRTGGEGSVRNLEEKSSIWSYKSSGPRKISLSGIRGHWPRIFLLQLELRQIVAGIIRRRRYRSQATSNKRQASSTRIPDSSSKRQAPSLSKNFFMFEYPWCIGSCFRPPDTRFRIQEPS